MWLAWAAGFRTEDGDAVVMLFSCTQSPGGLKEGSGRCEVENEPLLG